MRFAFGVEGFLDKKLKNDTSYVKSFARLFGHRNGHEYEKLIPFHICSDEDYQGFKKPSQSTRGLFDYYKTKKERFLYCLDWETYGDDL